MPPFIIIPGISIGLLRILKELNIILEVIEQQEEQYTEAFYHILRELKSERIHLVDEKEINAEQGEFVKSYFKNQVRPLIFPIIALCIQLHLFHLWVFQ